MPTETQHLPPTWAAAITLFVLALRAAGRPETTIGTRVNHLRRAARTLRVPDPWAVDGPTLVRWAGRQDWAVETRRSYRASLLAFYRWGHGEGRIDHVPAEHLPKVTPAPPRPRPAPESDYKLALMAAAEREHLMLRLGAEAGLRRAEVAVAHSRDLSQDLTGWSLLVHGKGRRDRVIPLSDSLAAEIRSRGRGYLFPGNDCGHLSPRWVGKLITKLLPDGLTMHTLRHRFATVAYTHDRDVFAVQELLGHGSPETTRRYVKVPNDSLRRTMNAVAAA